ncbi:hypothetical protein PAPYR_13023 [Paratrimastix pyriformis]|uniref:Reverse transcriptase domain-containing protein n=1 Tax=Paratrimastix pyriformis TaxID=342808 RepID=A0ABQ8U3D6_9EUKA|nr:hypothetical protein PAPYR_13023 [Paratrimastix pyriformis]
METSVQNQPAITLDLLAQLFARIPAQMTAAPFPVLREPHFDAVLSFLEETDTYHQQNPDIALPPITRLLSTTTMEFLRVHCHCPERASNSVIVAALFEHLRPATVDLRVARLKLLVLDGSSRPTLLSDLSVFYVKWCRLAGALGFPRNRAVARYLTRAIRGELGELLEMEVSIDERPTLQQVYHHAGLIATRLVAADALTATRATLSRSRRSHNPGMTASTARSTAPPPGPPDPSHPTPASACSAALLDCWAYTVPIPVPPGPAGTGPLLQTQDDLPHSVAPTQGGPVVQPATPAAEVSALAATLTAASDLCPAVPAPPGVKGTVHLAADGRAYVEDRGLTFLLDSGSNVTLTSEHYALAKGLALTEEPQPRTVALANKQPVQARWSTTLQFRLSPDGPLHHVAALVLESASPAHVIVGMEVLKSYVIDYALGAGGPDPALLAEACLLCPISTAVLTPPQLTRVVDLLLAYRDVFGPLDNQAADVPPFHVELLDPKTPPVHVPPRRYYGDKAECLKREIKEMTEANIIVPSLGPYHQVPVDQASRQYLSFTCSEGTFSFCRMPFGIATAAGFFQQMIQQVMAGVPDADFYQDDAGLHSATFDHFMDSLEAFLSACRDKHLRVKGPKSEICPPALKFVGMIVDGQGYHVDPDRIKALVEMRPPSSRELLRLSNSTKPLPARSPGIGVLLNSNPSVPNFVMMHAEIKRNDDPFLRFLNRDISEKHLRYTDLDSDFKVLTQKMLPELAKLFGYITVHKQRVVSRALLKTIVEMLGSLEREMLVSSMTDFFYQVLGSVTWHAGQSDLESISSESPPSPKSLSGSKKGRAANPFEVTTVHPLRSRPFGNPFAHQPAAPTAPSTPVPDPVVAKPPASSRTPAPASAKG